MKGLKVKCMLASNNLARRIAVARWGEIGRRLAYKVQWRVFLVVAERFVMSSKTRIECGAVNDKLTLADRS